MKTMLHKQHVMAVLCFTFLFAVWQTEGQFNRGLVPINHFGGITTTSFVDGDVVYTNDGEHFTILSINVDQPYPTVIGKSEPMGDTAREIYVHGINAAVVEW